MRQLTSSDNLDNITDNGIYWYATESVPQNAPYQNASVVEVIGSSSATGEKFQRVTRYGVPGKSSWRPLGGGGNGWLAWAESLTNADLISSYYKGDEVTINASGTTDIITKNISSIIPSGCKIFTAFARAVNNAGGVINYVTYTENTISYRIRNLTNAPITVIPYIGLIFAK